MIGLEPGSIGSCARSMRCHVVLGGTNIDPQTVSKNASGKIRIYWDMHHYTGTQKIPHNKPDVVVVNDEEKLVTIIDFAVPLDHNMAKTKLAKIERYQLLAQDFRSKHTGSYRTKIIPVVVGGLLVSYQRNYLTI